VFFFSTNWLCNEEFDALGLGSGNPAPPKNSGRPEIPDDFGNTKTPRSLQGQFFMYKNAVYMNRNSISFHMMYVSSLLGEMAKCLV